MATIDILPMKNRIQHYAWGSREAIADLEGRPVPSERPEAELWMGAHPSGPSLVLWNGEWTPLDELIEAESGLILGTAVSDRFGRRLPFLFKVLAAEAPLSIQAHPNLAQAREGYQRENRLGIPLEARQRNYRDDNHKPEIICALSDFWALKGFRPRQEILRLIGRVEEVRDRGLLSLLEAGDSPSSLEQFFGALLSLDPQVRAELIRGVVDALASRKDTQREVEWMRQLEVSYPGDVGVLSPVLLNLVRLRPGEALFLEAGELHAYLRGVGVELMANSDNVLRGGLTSKHVDVEALTNVLTFKGEVPVVTHGELVDGIERVYKAPVREFRLSKISIGEAEDWIASTRRGVEILLCTEGCLTSVVQGGNRTRTVAKGESVLVPAAVGAYRLSGAGTLFRASIPGG